MSNVSLERCYFVLSNGALIRQICQKWRSMAFAITNFTYTGIPKKVERPYLRALLYLNIIIFNVLDRATSPLSNNATNITFDRELVYFMINLLCTVIFELCHYIVIRGWTPNIGSVNFLRCCSSQQVIFLPILFRECFIH